jgi:RNA polymerase sigma-70 factor (ECF subfamily)
MAAETDAELILRSLDRGEVFEKVFDRHIGAVHRYLRLRVGDALAEELAAETFTRAFQARRRFDARRTSALPWLYGIASNLIRMHWRSEQRRLRAYGLAAERDLQPAPSGEVDARLDAAAEVATLTETLTGLPAGQREVLLLHAWAELSHAEIAEALALSEGTVRKRLHRARRALAERLERSGNGLADDAMLEARQTR